MSENKFGDGNLVNGLRKGERTVSAPAPKDAGLIYIGRIRTPWRSRADCPRQGFFDGPICRIELFEPWQDALQDIAEFSRLEVLYWLHESRRDVVLQSPRDDGATRGTFSIRSPLRPNPIATSIVELVAVEGATLLVRGMDCLDGTPLLDLKPDRTLFIPMAQPTAGDLERTMT